MGTRVTVAINTHERPAALLQMLGGLERQTGVELRDLELLIVVDGHGDPAAGVLERYDGPLLPRILIQVREGRAAARNRALREAGTPVVIFLDDDVIPAPGLVAAHLRVRRAHPDAVVVGRVDPLVGSLPWMWHEAAVQRRLHRGRSPRASHWITTRNLSAPAALLLAVGGFTQRLPRRDDVELAGRLLAHGAEVLYEPDAQAEEAEATTFEEWAFEQAIDGRIDASIHRDFPHMGGVESLLRSYHRLHPANRAALRLALSLRQCERTSTAVLTMGAGIPGGALSAALCDAAMSMLANVLYWGGVRDSFRGNRAFWRAVGASRQSVRSGGSTSAPPVARPARSPGSRTQ
jgi:Glycosyl transferase family 2